VRRTGSIIQAKIADAVTAASAVNTDPATPYRDMHAWQFTPSSFQLILLELAWLKQLDWSVETCSSAIGCEFRVGLRRGGIDSAQQLSAEAFEGRRLDLLKAIVLELGEQAGYAEAK